MKYGAIYDIMKQDEELYGKPMPDDAKNKPELDEALLLYWMAWGELSNDRNLIAGMSHVAYLPIKFKDVDKWAKRNELNDRQTEFLRVAIPMMDSEYLKEKNG